MNRLAMQAARVELTVLKLCLGIFGRHGNECAKRLVEIVEKLRIGKRPGDEACPSLTGRDGCDESFVWFQVV